MAVLEENSNILISNILVPFAFFFFFWRIILCPGIITNFNFDMSFYLLEF